MKKSLVLLLCLMLVLPVCGAESQSPFRLFPTPTPDFDLPDETPPAFETPAPAIGETGGSLRLSVLDKVLTLDFDDDPLYSMLDDGYIQASFYAYDAEDTLYELYLLFPDNVSTGSVVDIQSSLSAGMLDCGIMLYVSGQTTELYAVAAQNESGAYPSDSDYAITFTEVSRSGSRLTFSGTAKATLVALDDLYNPLYPVENLTASFHFTMNAGETSTPSFDTAPNLPSLIAPPDAKKI